ncbi:MAG: hypothetical protein K9W45_03300 [Candidatus Heimdallarchaeum aukensis]|uniref:Uncharacterized protein n=1 Tax=Candidatus Heimdallarchaeum aukensis TaxID=2876573 RepID=A0A9Y1BM95_9ARCH|nr:MAG: hypothetical protein K9W45_03300 [Candidatus Heimdallarchaeum aukensis]
MKKITKIFFSVCFLLLISILTFSQFSKGLYSPDLKDNTVYTWNVQTLAKVGTFDTPYLSIDDSTIKQGDVIKLRLLNNTDEVANGSVSNLWGRSNVWFDLFINNEFVTNDSDVPLFALDWMGIPRIYFDWANQYDFYWVLPVEFTNETGTYEFFEVTHSLFNNLKLSQSSVQDYHGYYSSVSWNLKQISKLSNLTWSLVVKWSYKEKTEDRTSPDWSIINLEETISTEFRFNRKTGLLVYLSYKYTLKQNEKSEGVETNENESLDLLITSNELPTKASTNFILYMITILTVTSIKIVYSKRKKK